MEEGSGITVGGGCYVHVYLHTHFAATRNSVINLISVVTFRSAALVKVDTFVKALSASTSDVPTSWNTLRCALILCFGLCCEMRRDKTRHRNLRFMWNVVSYWLQTKTIRSVPNPNSTSNWNLWFLWDSL